MKIKNVMFAAVLLGFSSQTLVFADCNRFNASQNYGYELGQYQVSRIQLSQDGKTAEVTLSETAESNQLGEIQAFLILPEQNDLYKLVLSARNNQKQLSKVIAEPACQGSSSTETQITEVNP